MFFSQKNHSKPKPTREEMLKSWSFLLLVCVVLPLIIRSFLFSPFHIPSGSMKSGLLVGDYLFVSKYAYGYSRFSFPLSPPLFEGRIFEEEPERGDVIVFRVPSNTRIDYIKRLVGLPGDKIQVRNGRLYLNGERLQRKRVDDFVEKDKDGNERRYKQYLERIPEGDDDDEEDDYQEYYVLDERTSQLDNTPVFTVPEGHYFFMGDNRDNSQDSRVKEVVGFVPKENLVGRAEVIFISSDASFLKFWEWFPSIRTDRVFKTIE